MTEELSSLPEKIHKIYNTCSVKEQEYLMQILKELSDTGESPTYQNLWLADYKEIPVDIDTFLDSPTYLGKVTREGQSISPHWRVVLHDIFDAGNKWEEIILTGATRIGKSSTGITRS